jgi:hypoxanthine phosphoribosyltransferase
MGSLTPEAYPTQPGNAAAFAHVASGGDFTRSDSYMDGAVGGMAGARHRMPETRGGCAPAAFGGSGRLVSDKLDSLLSAEELSSRVRELGAQISEAYKGENLVLVCVLKGSFVFTADLARAIDQDVNLRIEFLGVQSYGEGTESTGIVQITQDLTKSIENEHVLIVEDIVDTGLTISHLLELFGTRKPASVKVCSLLHKPARTRIDVEIDYLGFTIEDKFVVGYGLDWAQRYRNLPFIGVIAEQSIAPQ